MKHTKELLGAASAVVFFVSLTAVSSAVTLTLGPNLNAGPTMAAVGAAASCATPYAAAAVRGTPWAEGLPDIVEGQGASGGTAFVEIKLQPSGALSNYALLQSSGNRWTDDAALRTARMTKYSAETENCTAVGGDYLLEVDF
jgi:TonB family protein